jgi:hypothetical protein
MRPSLRSFALAALAASLALAPLLAAAPAPAADAVTVPDVGGLIWQDAVTALTGAGLVARSAGDGVVVPDASTVADQCPRANASVAAGSTVTLSVRTTIATCASGGGSGGGGPQPVAMWPLDETSGTTANDATGTGHSGAYVGGVALGGPGSPKNGNAAATFTGGGVSVPYSADLNPGAYTVEAWVNPSSVNTYMDQGTAARPIACSRDAQGLRGYMLYADNYTGTPQFAFVVGAGSSRRYVYDNSGVAEQPGLWYHVVGSFDGTDLHLYVNGVEVTSAQLNDGDGTDIQPLADSSFPLQIGMCNGGSAPWNGAIQDLTFWNGALDAATIAQHASAGTPPPGGGGGGGSNDCDPSAPRCTQGGGPQRPLILIPGTLGSYIGTSSGTVFWPPDPLSLINSGSDSFLDTLAFDNAGNGNGSPMLGKGTGGLIGATKVCVPGIGWPCYTESHHYDETVSKLVDLGYTYNPPGSDSSNQTLFTFPYDWRLSMATNAGLLQQRIEEVRGITGAASVDILAHSQGGLVASSYLRLYLGEHVHRVVTVGTPYVGAPKFLSVLEYGFPCEIGTNSGCFLNPDEAAKLVRNFPGSLELLPSERYWELAPSPLVERDVLPSGTVEHVYSFQDVLDLLTTDGKNGGLLRRAQAVHSMVDQFPISLTPILRIAGIDTWTLDRIQQQVTQNCQGNTCRWDFAVKTHYGSGDGTVPVQSAQVRNCTTGVNLDTSSYAHSARRAGVSHDDLIRDSAVLSWADTFFRTGTSPSPCGAGTVTRRLAATASDGISGIALRTVGPLVGFIRQGTDMTGTIDPASGGTAEDIPDSMFDPTVGAATYAISDPGPVQGAFTATAAGTVRLELTRYADDAEVETAVTPNLDVSSGALVSVSYAQPQDFGLLQVNIDDDGNGTVDRTVPFEQPITGDAIADAAPPTSNVTVTHFLARNGHLMARVVVDATDDGGAGIGNVAWHTTTGLSGSYTGPFVLPAQGDLQVVATDRAGNVQVEPSWGVLDDRTGLPYRVTDFKPRQLHGVGLVDYAGDVDLWGIQSDGGYIRAELAGLFFAAHLELDDAAGTVIATGDERRDHPEKLDVRVPAGDYLLKVTGSGGAHDLIRPYLLNATATRG